MKFGTGKKRYHLSSKIVQEKKMREKKTEQNRLLIKIRVALGIFRIYYD